MSTATATSISLIDSLEREWVKLVLPAARSVGPAAQTLGGLLAVTNRETFIAVGEIAARARVPVRTAERHLATLAAGGWIDRRGRETTRANHLRRTATINVKHATLEATSDYGILPWWACSKPRRRPSLSWSARLVLSLVMSRLAGIRKLIQEQTDESGEALAEAMADWTDQEAPFRWSLSTLQKSTGLNRDAVIGAKRQLNDAGIIRLEASGDALGRDSLTPNFGFRVVVTPTNNNRCWVDYDAS